MKLLVTGCAGFIGSRFCEMAIGHGCEIVGVDLLTYAGRTENIDLLEPPKFRFYHGDICDDITVHMLLKKTRPDAVVNFAAESHVARSIQNREEFLRTNVIGSDVLMSECMRYWKAMCAPYFKYINISTDEVYGSLGHDEEPWTEDSPYAPNNPYAASKAAADHLARAYWRTYGFPAITTHASNNYGPRQHPEKLIPTLVAQALKNLPLTMHGDGLNIRDWIHVDDHCFGIMSVLKHGEAGETYNFGGECERSNLDIAELILKTIPSSNSIITFGDDRESNDRRYSSSCAKAYDKLNWLPAGSIEESICDTVAWYTRNPTYESTYGR